MLGLLLNSIRSATKISDELQFTYRTRDNLFGNGVKDIDLSQLTLDDSQRSDWKMSQLFNGIPANQTGTPVHTLDFNTLTVPTGYTLRPDCEYVDLGAKATNFAPMIIRCKTKLTVSGTITSAGCGGINARGLQYSGTRLDQWNQCRCPIQLDSASNPSWSCSTNNFYKLASYGASGAFLDGNTFLCGAGSGGYTKLFGGKARVYNLGFTSGGFQLDEQMCSGAGGGFLALYFEDLIIDGKHYGLEKCPGIRRISANGSYFFGYDGTRYQSGTKCGGGTIIIAAKTIELTGNGTINSDADGDGGNGQEIIRYSFINNPPHLAWGYEPWGCPGQVGHVMQSDGTVIPYTRPLHHEYYYSDGFSTYHTDSDDDMSLGGAGVVLGYKIKLVD